MGFIVTSKVLGIGYVERSWKATKKMKGGKLNKLVNDKVEKQTLVYDRYQQHNSLLRATDLASAGRLWNGDYFKCWKMDEKFQPLLDSLESMKTCDDN